jgi:Type I restriction modification DNA specificity domain
VCFTCIGATIGKACLTDATSLTNQQINTIVVDEHNYDPAFVYYRLVADREAIRITASGAATPIISKSAFENVRVRTPPLSTQRKIAAILSAYDDLIENNNRRIKVLGEMAQRIYREWFVDFRYPGHEDVSLVDTKIGQVPDGWEVESLFDVADVTFGYPFKSALFSTLDGRPVVRIRDIPAGESATLTTEAPSPMYEIETGDILVGNGWRLPHGALVVGSCVAQSESRQVPAKATLACGSLRALSGAGGSYRAVERDHCRHYGGAPWQEAPGADQAPCTAGLDRDEGEGRARTDL